jgi:hypothetical protein
MLLIVLSQVVSTSALKILKNFKTLTLSSHGFRASPQLVPPTLDAAASFKTSDIKPLQGRMHIMRGQ